MSGLQPEKARQTVNADGTSVAPRIAGVTLYSPPTHQDHRGTLCEIYQPSWGYDAIPLVSAYLVTVRPGQVKGWAVHHNQTDRYFFVSGTLKLVLFDGRPDSPTHGMINEMVFSEINRSLVTAPPGVYHAVENIGVVDGLMFNLPSEPYNYLEPDKSVLPLDTDQIPYKFNSFQTGY